MAGPVPDSAAQTPHRAIGRGIVLSAVALSTIVSIDRVTLALSGGRIAAALHLTDAQMGLVFSAYATAYSICEVPSGFLGDRFGPRPVLMRIAICWSSLMAATAAAFGFFSLYCSQLLFGAGQAGCYPNISRLFSQWLPQSRIARAQGLIWLSARWSGAFTPIVVALLFRYLSWRQTFLSLSSLGLLWAVVFFLWYRRRVASFDDPPDRSPTARPWSLLARSTTLRLLCGQYVALVFPWYFLITWAPAFIDERFHLPASQATVLKVLPLLCGGFGALTSGFVFGPIARRTGSIARARRIICCIGFAGAAAGLVFASRLHNPLAAVLAVGFSSFCNDITMPVIWETASDVGGRWSATVAAVMNMAGNAGGALYGLTAGLILQHTHRDWTPVLLMGAVVYLTGIPQWFALDPVSPIDAPTSP